MQYPVMLGCTLLWSPYPRSCSPCSHNKLRSVPRSSSLTDLAPCPCIKVPFIPFKIRTWGQGTCRCPTMSQADSLLFRKSTSGVVCRRPQSCSCFSVLSLGRLHSRVLASSSIRIVEHNLGHQNVHSLSPFPPNTALTSISVSTLVPVFAFVSMKLRLIEVVG